MSLNVDLLKDELIRDEGVRYSAYQDHLGYWTIGVGRLIDARRGGQLSPEEVDMLLHNDVLSILEDIQSEPWYLSLDTDNRRRAILNMRFQLGGVGIRKFRNSLNLISQKKWAEAARNLRLSLWYKQTPARAERVIRMIEFG